MSMIHSSCDVLGPKSAVSEGTARCRTVMSIAMSSVGMASTASPIHSFRPARGAAVVVMKFPCLVGRRPLTRCYGR